VEGGNGKKGCLVPIRALGHMLGHCLSILCGNAGCFVEEMPKENNIASCPPVARSFTQEPELSHVVPTDSSRQQELIYLTNGCAAKSPGQHLA
jgi:hypothetical protein